MSDTIPAVTVLAEGEANGEAYLRKAGLSDFELECSMDLEFPPGRWPNGCGVDRLSDIDNKTMTIISIGHDGVWRLESRPAELFFAYGNGPYDDETDEEFDARITRMEQAPTAR